MVGKVIILVFFFFAGFITADIGVAIGDDHPEESVSATTTGKANLEILKVNVTRTVFDEETGQTNEQILEIKLQMHIINGIVHVNNIPTHHSHVVAIMLLAEIAEIKLGTNERTYQRAPVVVRIMVTEEPLEVGYRLKVQEEIVQISGQEVIQVEVQEVVMVVDNKKTEMMERRTVTGIQVSESEIHQKSRHEDHFVRDDKLGPNEPYNLDDPELPDEPYHMDDKHHKRGNSLCRKFHKLPLAARITIFAVIILITVATFLGCIRMFCRKNVKQAEKFKTDFDDKIFLDDDDLEAPPLDKKEPLDKQRLLFVA